MPPANTKKLQSDVELTLKKVEENLVEYETLWEAAHEAESPQNKWGEKLKKSIDKLQRHRLTMKDWLSNSSIGSDLLTRVESKVKIVEEHMRNFREFEKESKTKAYSDLGLAKPEEEDPEEQERRICCEGFQTLSTDMQSICDDLELELEPFTAKKSLNEADKRNKAEIEEHLTRARWHIGRLDAICRAVMNEQLTGEELEGQGIQDGVQYFLDSWRDPDYFHDDALYETLGLPEEGEEDRKKQEAIARQILEDKKAAEKKKKESRRKKAPQSTGSKLKVEKKADDVFKVQEEHLVSGDCPEELQCGICFDLLGNQPVRTKCGHVFCGDCLGQWCDQGGVKNWASRAKEASKGQKPTVPCPSCKTLVSEDDCEKIEEATSPEAKALQTMLNQLKVRIPSHAFAPNSEAFSGTWQAFQQFRLLGDKKKAGSKGREKTPENAGKAGAHGHGVGK